MTDKEHEPELVEHEWSSTPKAERPHHTALSVEADFAAWRERRQERRAAKKATRKRWGARRWLATALAAAIVGTLAGNLVYRNSTQSDITHNAQRIDQLSSEVDAADLIASADGVTAADLETLRTNASEKAKEVAVEQQQFAQLYFDVNDAAGTGNGAPTEQELAIGTHREALAPLWDTSSWLVETPLAYQWTTGPMFDSDQIDPRFEWYIRYDGSRASDPSTYVWQTESVSPSTDGFQTARVTWTCMDFDGTVLAWATAQYNDATGLFSDLTLVVTADGARNTLMADGALQSQVPHPVATEES